jgi:hypothetical protein
MSRSQLRVLLRLGQLLALLIVVALFASPLASSRAQSQANGPEAAWLRVREAGSYRFTVDLVQRTLPLPTVTNAGRAVKEDRAHLEGQTDLIARQMNLQLWSQGGSVLDPRTGVEIEIDGERARARQNGGAWQDIENVVDWAAPSGDFLAFLAATKNVVAHDDDRRYTFDLDGKRFGAYMRDLLEERLRAKGELPLGASLEVAQSYAEMTGRGELWLDANGLPRRQVLHLQFPDQKDQRVEADITVEFSDFAYARGASLTGSAALAAKVVTPQTTSAATALLLGAGLTALLLFNARSRQLRVAITLALIVSFIVPPLVTSAQIERFNQRVAQAQAAAAGGDNEMTRTLKALQEVSPSVANAETLTKIRGDDGTDRDGDGRSDVQEALHGSNPALRDQAGSIPLFSQASNLDSDGDGLTDYEESLLGTDATSADTDGDLITDTLEINGFTYNSKLWATDPLEMDTNRDGVGDTQEWRFADSNWDADGDGTPDLFDYDNDNDGVPDRLDLSAGTRLSQTFTYSNPFQLSVANLQNKPTYVEFQLRPTNPAYLWYAFNVFDWPSDNAGQMRDTDGQTYYDVCVQQATSQGKDPNTQCGLTPDDNGDVKLVPVLEIDVQADAMNPRTLFEGINAYGITRRWSPDYRTVTLQVPLQLVTDDRTGQQVAFTGKLLFRGASWGPAQSARLAWVVQGLVDATCMQYDSNNNCLLYQNNVAQPLHAYYTDWQLTGLDIREDHGANIGLIYEDPAVDDNLNNDNVLQSLALGLDYSFLAGTAYSHTLNSRLYRDMQIFHINSRFDRIDGGESGSAFRRWNLPNILRVDTSSYEHIDEALATTVTTNTKQILNTAFTPAWSASAPFTPTILMAREEYFRTMNLDDPNGSLSWSGNRLTLDMNGTGGNEVTTLASLKWTPYQYDGAKWQAAPIEQYWDEFERRHFPELQAANSDSDVANGKLLFAQLYYLALYAGVESIVEKGNVVLTTNWGKSTFDISGNIGKGVANGINVMVELWSAGAPQAIWKALGQLKTLKAAGGGLAAIKTELKNGELYKLMKSPTFRTAVLVAALFLVIVTIFVLAAAFPDGLGGGKEGALYFKVATAVIVGAIVIGLMIIRPIIQVIQVANTLSKSSSLLTRLAEARRIASPVTKATKVIAVIGLIIDLGVTWGFFFAAWAKGDIKPGTIAFNHAVAVSIAATVLAVVVFALAFVPVVGPIIIALIVVVDLILAIFDTSLSELIAQAIHGGGPLIEMRSADDISNSNHRPPRKLVVLSNSDIQSVNGAIGLVDGARVRFVATVTTNAFQPVPDTDHGYGHIDTIWSDASLRKAAFLYALTDSSSTTLSTPDLNSRQNDWRDLQAWKAVTFAINGKTAYLRYGRLIDGLTGPTVTLQKGLNRALNLYFSMAYRIPAYECWGYIGYDCKVSPSGDVQSFGDTIDPQSLDLVVDVFPRTLDEYYAFNWDSALGPQADRDGDGLRVSTAPFNGNDPDDTEADTDGDGLSDRFELTLRNNGVPVSFSTADTDGDGLSDYAEAIAGESFVVTHTISLGSNPALADSDGDGLGDQQELEGWVLQYATGKFTRVTSDPLVRDTDGDGLSDKVEFDLHATDAAQYPFHPRVPNSQSFVAFEYGFSTTYQGRPVIGADTTTYTTTIFNRLPAAYTAQGGLTVTLPAQLQAVSGSLLRPINLPGEQSQIDTFPLRTAPGATSGPRAIVNDVGFGITSNPLTTTAAVTTMLPTVTDRVTVTVDADRPAVGATSVFGYFQPGSARVIHGSASDATTGVRQVEISDNGSTWVMAEGRETWQALWTPAASEGAHTLFARAIDSVGNVQLPVSSLSYRSDGTPPNVTHNLTPNAIIRLTRNTNGQWFIPLSGTSSDPNLPGGLPGSGQERMFIEVTSNGHGKDVVWPDVFNNWGISYTLTLADNGEQAVSDPSGAYTVTIESYDLVGNVRTTIVPLRVDNREPSHAIVAGLPITNLITSPIALSGRITETGPIIAGVANMEAIYFPADTGYSPGQWRAQYFNNNSWRRPPADTAIVADLNFDWGNGAPTAQVSADNFSALFERETTFRVAGAYRFTATLDADAQVTAYLDDVPVLSGGVLSSTVHVDAGSHALRVIYREGTGAANVAFGIEVVDPDWLPLTIDQAGAGVIDSAWTYTIPIGLEGFYRLGLRGVDQIGNRSDQSFAWEAWRGEIDTAAPRASLEVYFTGFDSTAQTHYVVSIEDFNLTEVDLAQPCGAASVQRFYYPTNWWRTWFDDNTRLFQITAECSVPGFVTQPPEVRACDNYDHCTAVVPALPANPNYRTVYFSDKPGATGRIARVSLDNLGAGVQTLIANAGVSNTLGLAVDAVRGHVYWIDRSAGSIRRANLADGSNVITILSGLQRPMGLALDNANRLYWTEFFDVEFGPGAIKRADITGTNVITLNTTFGGQPTGLTLDLDNGKVYWAQSKGAQYNLNRMNLDGSNVQNDVALAPLNCVHEIGGIAVNGPASQLYWLDANCQFGFYDNGIYTATVPYGFGNYIRFTMPITTTSGLAIDRPSEKIYWTTLNALNRAALNGAFTETIVSGLSNAAGLALDFNYAPIVTSTQVPIFQNVPGAVKLITLDTDNDPITYTITTAPVNGSLSGAAPNLTYTPALNFTGRDVITFTASDGRGTPTVGRVDLDVLPIAGLDAAVITPTQGAVIVSSSPISISGGAYALATLKALTVTVDGAPIYAPTWPPSVITSTAWAMSWTPTNGKHTLNAIAASHSGEVQTDTHPVEVWVDLTPPTITIVPTVLTTTHLLPQPNVVAVRGTVTDTTGVDRVEVRVSGEPWRNAAVNGGAWEFPWQAPFAIDGAAALVTARATDRAGRTQQVTDTLYFDFVPPRAVTLTLAYTNSLGARVPISVGALITDTPIQLIMDWTPSFDGNGLSGYWAGWTTSETLNPAALTFKGSAATQHAQAPGEAQKLYAHLLIRDTYNNATTQTWGPIYVDAPLTPDRIGDLNDRGWQSTGGSQIGANRLISYTSLLPMQKLYTSWDATAMRFTWSGANWDGDGDLFIYLDTKAGGSTTAYNPYTITQPMIALGSVVADNLLWVKDSSTAQLWQWTGSSWALVQTLNAASFQLDKDSAPPHTDLIVPFASLGIASPAANSLRMVAFATEENRLNLWAAMPNHNPLNNPLVAQPLTTTQVVSLTRAYVWPSLGLNIRPNAGKFADEDLFVSIAPEPIGVAAGFLSDDLLDVLPPGTTLDANLDGTIDAALLRREGLRPIGPNHTITYTVSYENRGTAASSLTLTATARGALTFPGGTTKIITLPSVGAGVSSTLTFTATASGAGVSGEVDVTIAEPLLGPFEWWAIQHDVDRLPPTNVAINSLITTTRLLTNTATGTAIDPSGVPTITLQVTTLPGNVVTTFNCATTDPFGGQWSCDWYPGQTSGVTQIELRAKAIDGVGNVSPDWSAPVLLAVDATPPTITLDPALESALSSGVINQALAESLIISTTVTDNHVAAQVELCSEDGDCDAYALDPGNRASGRWVHPFSSQPVGDGVTHNLTLIGVDAAGNRSTPLVRTYTIDNVAPVLTVTVALDQVTGSVFPITPPVVLAGTVSDGYGVSGVYVRVARPNGQTQWLPATLNGANWSFTTGFTSGGVHVLSVEARDRAGNVTSFGPHRLVVKAYALYLPVIRR